MKTYHEIAGRRPENTVGLKFDADEHRSTFHLTDSCCHYPKCSGSEISIALVALGPEKRTISFEFDVTTGQMAAPAAATDADMAIARELCSSTTVWYLLQRRRQIVRAWGLAHQEGRLGPRRRFTGMCYSLWDFDKHNDPFVIHFTHSDESWSVMDQYCVSPECPCTYALLSFYHHSPGETRAVPAFSVKLDLRDGTYEAANDLLRPHESRKVVESFLSQSPDWRQELDQRRRLLREIAARRVLFPPEHRPDSSDPVADGPVLRILDAPHESTSSVPDGPILRIIDGPAAARASSADSGQAGPTKDPSPVPAVPSKAPPGKISRNAPCPCGSRREYKKCCGKESP